MGLKISVNFIFDIKYYEMGNYLYYFWKVNKPPVHEHKVSGGKNGLEGECYITDTVREKSSSGETKLQIEFILHGSIEP